MSCGRAAEIDLAAFAADPRAPEWREFRAHYPLCADCSREVGSWRRLRGALEQSSTERAAHPADADLLAFASDLNPLPEARRREIEAHLSGCAPCRTELSVLRGFDFAALGVESRRAARRPAADPVREQRGLIERLAELTEHLFGVGLQPAFAAALLIAIAVPVGFVFWRMIVGAPTQYVPIAHEEPARTPEEPSRSAPEDVAPAPATAPQLAHEPPPPPELPQVPDAPVVPAPPPIVAKAPPVPPAPRPSADPSATPPADIASLLPEQPPVYRPVLALAGGSLDPVRRDTFVRAEAGSAPEVHALGPEHVGATLRATPTLYWHLASASSAPIELVVADDRSVEPLVEKRLEAPVAPGIHALDLGALGVTLAPGVTYTWTVSIVRDEARRDRDVSSSAAVRRAAESPEIMRRLDDAGPAARAHALANAGFWYDAFDALSRWAEADPEIARLPRLRAALLEQVGLGDVATALAKPAR